MWTKDLKQKKIGRISGKTLLTACLMWTVILILTVTIVSELPNAIDQAFGLRAQQQTSSETHQYHPTTYGWDWKGDSK